MAYKQQDNYFFCKIPRTPYLIHCTEQDDNKWKVVIEHEQTGKKKQVTKNVDRNVLARYFYSILVNQSNKNSPNISKMAEHIKTQINQLMTERKQDPIT